LRGCPLERRVRLHPGKRRRRPRGHDCHGGGDRLRRAPLRSGSAAQEPPEGGPGSDARGAGCGARGARSSDRPVADIQDPAPDRQARPAGVRTSPVMRIFDCHSHWGTRRGYIFRTEDELAQQEKIWRTKPAFFSEEEMVAYFRDNGAKVILDLSFTKFLPIEE